MSVFWIAMTMTIGCNVFFHIFQKSIAPKANPMASLVVTYSVALALCLIAYPFFSSGENLVKGVRTLNWASFALGGSILGLELGYLLVYRSGWNIANAGIYSNTCVGLILIPVGLLIYKETLSLVNVLGVVLAIFAIFLMGR